MAVLRGGPAAKAYQSSARQRDSRKGSHETVLAAVFRRGPVPRRDGGGCGGERVDATARRGALHARHAACGSVMCCLLQGFDVYCRDLMSSAGRLLFAAGRSGGRLCCPMHCCAQTAARCWVRPREKHSYLGLLASMADRCRDTMRLLPCTARCGAVCCSAVRCLCGAIS